MTGATQRGSVPTYVAVVATLIAWSLIPLGQGRPPLTGTSGASARSSTGAPGLTGGPGAVRHARVTRPTHGARPRVPGSSTVDPGGGELSSPADSPLVAGDPLRCQNIGATGPGVSASTVTVGVGEFDVGGDAGAAAFNIRPDVDKIIDTVVADINAHGGVACRKLQANRYRINPFNSTDGDKKCEQASSDGILAFLDIGTFATESNIACYTDKHHIPVVDATGYPRSYYQRHAPYLASYNADMNRAARQWVYGAAAAGLFNPAKGFRKLGLLTDTCFPEVTAEVHRDLAAVGVRDGQVSIFTLACTGTLVASPAEIQAAALKHIGDKVSLVFPTTSGFNVQVYLQDMADQNYRPAQGYGASDVLDLTAPSVDDMFNVNQWQDALGFTLTRTGDLNAGLPLPARAAACSRVLEAAGVRGVKTEHDDFARVYCDLFWMFTHVMATLGTTPTRESFGQAVPTIGRLDFAGTSDGLFSTPGAFSGANFVRPIKWNGSDCRCWRVTNPQFVPES